jgi:hypothetical protein
MKRAPVAFGNREHLKHVVSRPVWFVATSQAKLITSPSPSPSPDASDPVTKGSSPSVPCTVVSSTIEVMSGPIGIAKAPFQELPRRGYGTGR